MTLALRLSFALHLASAAAWWAWPQHWPWWLGVLVANHGVLAIGAMIPRSRLLGPNMTRLGPAASARREVALSFDDGPDPAVTPHVLDLLQAHGAHASFFCVGERALAHPDLVRKMVEHGHSVENHSAYHSNGFAFLGPRPLIREITTAQTQIQQACGVAPSFFRAPMGFRSPWLAPVLERIGLRYATWTRRGFDAVETDPQAVLARLTHNLRSGDILLLHDGHTAAPWGQPARRPGTPVVLDVLPALLDALHAQGLKPVSLPEACRNDPTL